MTEAALLAREIGGVGGWKERVRRVHAALPGATFNRAKDILYGRGICIRADEMDALRAAAGRRQEEQEAEANAELRSLVARIQVLENRLAQIDPDFHGPNIDALGSESGSGRGIPRREDRTMD